MKKTFIFSLLIGLLMWAAPVSAQLQDGSSCENAIPVDSAFVGSVPAPGTYWYSAWTYDLPLIVNYTPTISAPGVPTAVVDFTCVPGVYEDSLLNKIFNVDEGVDIEAPIHLDFDSTFDAGYKVYTLKVKKSYRDVLSVLGVDYNVQAFVKVTTPIAGNIDMVPDTTFRDCLSASELVTLGDSLQIFPNDTDRVFLIPYADWQDDSIRYVWHGTKPLTVWLGNDDCNFSLTPTDPNVYDYFDLSNDGKYKLTSQEVKDAIDNSECGGRFYARIATAGAGYLRIEHVPEREPEEGAVLLQYGIRTRLAANDTAVYYFPAADWTQATQFVAAARTSMTMCFSTTSHYALLASDPAVVASYTFAADGSSSVVELSATELKAITSKSVDGYIYVRFIGSPATTLTPGLWAAGDCSGKSTLIQLGQTYPVAAYSSNTIYRLRYADIARGTFTLTWNGTQSTLPTYIADTCVFALNATNIHLARTNGKVTGYKAIAKSSAYDCDSATVASWASYTDAEGFLYLRFNPSKAGSIVVTSVRAEEPEPLPCPDVQFVNVDTLVCDTLLPMMWRGHVYTAASSVRDTLRNDNGCDSIVYTCRLRTTHCVASEDPAPITPTPLVGSTVALTCSSADVLIYVTEEQDLVLLDQYGTVLDTWHQSPSDAPHAYTPVCGVQYTLRGKTNTFRIVR